MREEEYGEGGDVRMRGFRGRSLNRGSNTFTFPMKSFLPSYPEYLLLKLSDDR